MEFAQLLEQLGGGGQASAARTQDASGRILHVIFELIYPPRRKCKNNEKIGNTRFNHTAGPARCALRIEAA